MISAMLQGSKPFLTLCVQGFEPFLIQCVPECSKEAVKHKGTSLAEPELSIPRRITLCLRHRLRQRAMSSPRVQPGSGTPGDKVLLALHPQKATKNVGNFISTPAIKRKLRCMYCITGSAFIDTRLELTKSGVGA